MIAIIDYDAGNIKSVEKALQYLGQDAKITSDPDEIMQASHAILPGVGAFGDAMNRLRSTGLDQVIRNYTETGKPFLGICLGLQLLFSASEEAPGVPGLGLIEGEICRIPDGDGRKVPHIGWNDITISPGARLFSGIPGKPYVYFVHSYYLRAAHDSDVTATTEYGVKIDAAVEHGNIFATQFHPEKSSAAGLKILQNFTELQ